MTARVPGLWRYVVAHPSSLGPLVGAAWRVRRRGWWRRAPFLPVPDERYWEFRVNTAAGRGTLNTREVVAAARWTVAQRVGK